MNVMTVEESVGRKYNHNLVLHSIVERDEKCPCNSEPHEVWCPDYVAQRAKAISDMFAKRYIPNIELDESEVQ